MLQPSADPFDPNLLDLGLEHEYRIYADEGLETWALVDQIDYWHFVQWCWGPKNGKRDRNKVYLRRSTSVWVDGVRTGAVTFYLHIEVMKRTGIVPPSPAHTIVDHRDSNSLDCRRANLRWATPSFNRRNINGALYYGELL